MLRYDILTRNGEADRLAAQDLSQIEAITDIQLQTAIEELRRSTSNIEKQADVLKAQQSALKSLVKAERKACESRAQLEAGQLRNWEATRSQTAKLLDQLSQTVDYQIGEQEVQNKGIVDAVKINVDAVLKEDDKLLLSLQKLALDLEPVTTKHTDSLATVEELCARLIKCTVEGVRTKLDRVYLQALGGQNGVPDENDNAQELKELQEELESLYAEILPVAQMSAEQQFLEPARAVVAGTHGKTKARAVKAFEYVSWHRSLHSLSILTDCRS